jgi:hypothetical protein
MGPLYLHAPMTIFSVLISRHNLQRNISVMRSTVIAFVLLCVASSTASAQVFKIGPGLEYAIPLGSFGDRVGGGIGGAGQVRLDLPFISVQGAVDYIKFAEKELTSTAGGSLSTTKSSAEMWGLNAGATIGLLPFLYGGAEVGTYFVTERLDSGGSGSDNKVTLGSFAPLLGASFGMFDVSARYVFIKDSNFLLIRGVVFF